LWRNWEVTKVSGVVKTEEEKGGSEEKKGWKQQYQKFGCFGQQSDCYEELRLFIEYKIAKGNGWDEKFKGDRVFGDEILHYMDKIYNMCDKNDREALKNISKFSGICTGKYVQ